MKAKLIKTAAEYEAALAHVDSLMSARSGTREAEELELWVHLVKTYEDEHYPIPPPDPVEAIRFRMDQQGMKAVDLVPYLGSKSKVSEVLSGRRTLSLSMIRKLHEGLGIPSDVLLGQPSASPSPDLGQLDWSAFPLAEIVRRRWFGDSVRTARELRDRGEDILAPFLAPVVAVPARAALRQKPRARATADENALSAWKARVWHLAQQQRVGTYAAEGIDKRFIGEVARLSVLENGPVVAVSILAKAGVRVAIEPAMPRTYLDGAAMRFSGQAPIVALTLRYDRLDNFWFTLCHELAHIALHLQGDAGGAFLDDLEATDESRLERQADQTAADAMIEDADWQAFCRQGIPSRDDVIRFAASVRVHPAVVAGRYRREKKDFRIFSDLIGNRKVRVMFGQEVAA